MKVKTFDISDEQAANDFIQSVVLAQEGAIQVTSENTLVVFYEETKENYETHFIADMIERLKRNLFHEKIRLASAEAEVGHYKDKGGKSDSFNKALENQKDARDNIKAFEAKIAALESWTAKPTSKE